MKYQRFLIDKDYSAIITEEHFQQLFRDMPERVEQAEKTAEMNMLEYLDQYYEIEKTLLVGKRIAKYSPMISFPSNVYIKDDEHIYKTVTAINGYKKPTDIVYWELYEDMDEKFNDTTIMNYSQFMTYTVGQYVKFRSDIYVCVKENGYDLNNIQMPGVETWVTIETPEWLANNEYELNAVVEYDGDFYMLTTKDDYDVLINPSESDCWGMIGEYSLDYEYDFGEDSHDYVCQDGKVYKALMNPNADQITEGENIVREDPRNPNVIAHMTRIALYYLHQLISPTNISETRRWAYEDSMDWLFKASKFKINPQIPRKRDMKDGLPRVDWALATFQRDYDPWENLWLI